MEQDDYAKEKFLQFQAYLMELVETNKTKTKEKQLQFFCAIEHPDSKDCFVAGTTDKYAYLNLAAAILSQPTMAKAIEYIQTATKGFNKTEK